MLSGLSKVYEDSLRAEFGAFNLLEDISAKHLANMDPTKTIRIRRIATDQLYPYASEVFVPWYFSGHQTDPITQENLSYIAERVRFKFECMMYHDKETLQRCVENEALQSDLMQWYLFDRRGLDQLTSCEQVPLRMCCTLRTMELCGLLHHDMTPAEAEQCVRERSSPKNIGWLARTSQWDQHARMEHSDMLSFSRAVARQNGSIIVHHNRFMYIDAVGWFNVPKKYMDSGATMSLARFFAQRSSDGKTNHPVAITLVDLLEHMRAMYRLSLDKLIRRNKNKS